MTAETQRRRHWLKRAQATDLILAILGSVVIAAASQDWSALDGRCDPQTACEKD